MNSGRIIGIHSLAEDQNFRYKHRVKKFCETTSLKSIFYQNSEALFVDIGFETRKIDFTNFVVQIDGYISNIQDLKKIFNIEDNNQSSVLNKILESGIWEIENYLLGNYAISIFDKQRSRLKIFTDHFGTRPIYYAHKKKSYFLHASEINFLKNVPDINFTINEKRIFQYLCQYKENAEETFFKEIFLLKPHHIIEFNNGNFKIASYEHHKKYKFQGNTLDEAKKELFYALKTATIQNSPVDLKDSAVLLSGGLDSSCIYSIIDNEYKNIKSISKNFFSKNGDKLICDETYFQELIHKGSLEHRPVSFMNKSPFSKADLWLETFGEPFNLANIYLFDEVYSEAKKNGIKQIIDGVDGDTVISHGYERFKELFRLRSFHNFIYEILRFSKKHNYSEYTNKSLFKMFLFPLMRSKKLFQPLFFLRDLFSKKSIPRRRIVKKDVLNEIGFEEPYDINRNFRSHSDKLKNPLISIAFVNLNILLFKYNINQHSPFFDKRVVDLCCSFPSKFKLNHGKSRFILRETFANFLPKEIINRYSKANLTHNFVENITENDLQNIESEINNIHPLIKSKISKENLLEEFKLLKSKTISSMTIMNIWNFYLVNRWLRMNS